MVSINSVKPRKGAFVVSIDGRVAIELLDMPRPFVQLKALDIEAAVRAALQL